MQNNKQLYTDLIAKFDCELSFKEDLLAFINSYNGTNDEDFENLIMSAVSIMVGYSESKIKADGYDKIVKAQNEFKQEVNDLKHEYNELKKGNLPVEPFNAANFPEENPSID